MDVKRSLALVLQLEACEMVSGPLRVTVMSSISLLAHVGCSSTSKKQTLTLLSYEDSGVVCYCGIPSFSCLVYWIA